MKVDKFDLLVGKVNCKCAQSNDSRILNFISENSHTYLHKYRDDKVLEKMCPEHAQDYLNYWNNRNYCESCGELATNYYNDTDSWLCDKHYKEYVEFDEIILAYGDGDFSSEEEFLNAMDNLAMKGNSYAKKYVSAYGSKKYCFHESCTELGTHYSDENDSWYCDKHYNEFLQVDKLILAYGEFEDFSYEEYISKLKELVSQGNSYAKDILNRELKRKGNN